MAGIEKEIKFFFLFQEKLDYAQKPFFGHILYKTDMCRITCFIALFFLVVLLSETKRLIFIWTFNLYFYSFCEKVFRFPYFLQGCLFNFKAFRSSAH